MDPALITNIIAIGDSDVEMDAAYAMSLWFTQECFVKTVKLIDRPRTPDDLSRQLR